MIRGEAVRYGLETQKLRDVEFEMHREAEMQKLKKQADDLKCKNLFLDLVWFAWVEMLGCIWRSLFSSLMIVQLQLKIRCERHPPQRSHLLRKKRREQRLTVG